MDGDIEVRYELLRPARLRGIRATCPIAYLPVGALEWHGVHNPLGCDGLKAHAICCAAAERHGGVVLPPLYLGMLGDGVGWGPPGWEGCTVTCHDRVSLEDTIHRCARGLVANGWRVLVGVTGHDIETQRDAIHDGIRRACAGTEASGFGVTEGENWEGGASLPCSMDHAGSWETSVMLAHCGGRVDLDALRQQMGERAALERTAMDGPEGMGGANPLHGASAELGRRIIGFCADRLGRKARAVLAGSATPPERADKRFMDDPGPTD